MTILYDSLICYKQTKITNNNKIKYFLEQHSTKEGTWGQLILHTGQIDFIFLDGAGNELSSVHLDKDNNTTIKFPPSALHKITQISKKFSATLKFYCMPHRYFNKKYKLANVHDDFLYILSHYLKGVGCLNVLDVGCGSGRNLLYCALKGHHATGIDINEKALSSINKIAKQEKMDNVQTFFCNLNMPLALKNKTYDFIISTVCLQFLEAKRIPSLLNELQEHTAHKGLHFLVFPVKAEQFSLPDTFTFLPDKNEIYRFYQDRGWAILEYNEQVGNLHRLDESGRPIQGQFGLILAQKQLETASQNLICGYA